MNPSHTSPGEASRRIARFARETLGCQCPPEVFERIAELADPLPGLPEIRRRIAIGDRLLIYVVETPGSGGGAALAVARLGDWVAAGRAERDRRGMNRLRLALVLDDPDPATVAALESAFARLPGLSPPAGSEDPRIHLHCLPRAALAGL